MERSLKASRIATFSLLSINIEITRRKKRPRSESDILEAAVQRNRIDRQLEREASVAFARLLQRG